MAKKRRKRAKRQPPWSQRTVLGNPKNPIAEFTVRGKSAREVRAKTSRLKKKYLKNFSMADLKKLATGKAKKKR